MALGVRLMLILLLLFSSVWTSTLLVLLALFSHLKFQTNFVKSRSCVGKTYLVLSFLHYSGSLDTESQEACGNFSGFVRVDLNYGI